ncbi:hypothetical protein C2R22_05015 [Salinigranum rubrum]|uniref:Uncharacterized protein n=1 Tax=Salinigranum rubrum TaxID=755307 RepID=A0A2I8VGP8_9EURY|nr:hypothetical protein [Salinigranum rubrum]AUV81098.1 hypothetical protein C2R22_05015 [Salinigranum rubrum]
MNTPPARTKRTLRAFADGTRRKDPERVVEEAAATLDSVESATRFLAEGGEVRLTEAVVRAVRDGESESVRRGRHVLGRLRALDAALAGESVDDGSEGARDCPRGQS